MKLYFQGHNYNYAVEQMMMTLFPGQRPEYPEGEPDGSFPAARVTLTENAHTLTAHTTLWWEGGVHEAERSASTDELTGGLDDDRVRQRIIRFAFYDAGVAALGHEPPWGALTGVRPVKLPTRWMEGGMTPEQARATFIDEYRVTPGRADVAMDCAVASLSVKQSLRPDELSLYIGIPFCPTRCAYCSFISADVGRSLKLVEPYLEQVLDEITYTGEVLRQNGLTVRSFYMGGGTPTTLSAQQMDLLLTHMEQHLPLEQCVEYTVEAGRPDTITREKLEVLKKHNIGRISINPQTLEEHVLRAIGRRHTPGDIQAAYQLAREVGFESINMDLIAGLPQDSFEGFRRTLEGVLELDPENITIHTLALKKGSTLMEKGGRIPDGEEVAQMLELSLEQLRGHGYIPYYLYRQKYMSGSLENVGWAKPGKESLYNIVMMEELQTVVSIGAGGITKLVDAEAGKILRLPNPKYAHDYLTSREKVLSQKDEITGFYPL